MSNDPPIDPTPTPPSKWQDNRLIRVGIRAVRTYLQTFVAIVGLELTGTMAASVGNIAYIPADTAGHMVGLSAYIALWPAGVALIQNLIEELARMDPGTTLRG